MATRPSITEFNRNNGTPCDDCGTECQDNCLVCGAPQCCPKCCAEATAEIIEAREERTPCPNTESAS